MVRPRILSELTLVSAFDERYVNRLRCTWPTWMHCRPWLRSIPVLLIYDATMNLAATDLAFLGSHPAVTLVPWEMPEAKSQRERMLTALVRVPAERVQTTWYLKLDADTYARTGNEWIRDDWFEPLDERGTPAYVASPWSYTKPADAIARLDDWGDRVSGMQINPRLNLPVKKGSSLVRHRRMASWVFYGNTDWTRRVSSLAEGRLPCPSQDTYLSYCAARLRSPVRHVKMSQYGWAHCSNFSRLSTACAQILGQGLGAE